MKHLYSPLIERNKNYIRNNHYDILSNGYQLYKKFDKYEVLITDCSSRPFEIDLWYIISIDVWIKDSDTDIVIKNKQYRGNFFFPKIRKIEQFIQKTIKSVT